MGGSKAGGEARGRFSALLNQEFGTLKRDVIGLNQITL